MTAAEVIREETSGVQFRVLRRRGSCYLPTDLVLRYESAARAWNAVQAELARAYEEQEAAR